MASVPTNSPTTTHVVPEQATPERTAADRSLGVEASDHVAPLRSSARTVTRLEVSQYQYTPTALQEVGEVHDTLARWLLGVVGNAVDVVAHDPFHTSAVVPSPTATHD